MKIWNKFVSSYVTNLYVFDFIIYILGFWIDTSYSIAGHTQPNNTNNLGTFPLLQETRTSPFNLCQNPLRSLRRIPDYNLFDGGRGDDDEFSWRAPGDAEREPPGA